MNLNDGIYCYYKDNAFNPIINESIEVYYNRKTYYFKSFEEMISFSFLDGGHTIGECIEKITW